MKRGYKFCHIEVRRFAWKIEIACFNKRGGFLWAFYLPTFLLLTRKQFQRQASKLGKEA